MLSFIEDIALICLAGGAIILVFIIGLVMFEVINLLSKGRFLEWIVNRFK